ncbi:MAG: TonB family protein [bacterium]|nr:TonB family protein [bacterium]
MSFRITLSFSTTVHLILISFLWVFGTTMKPKSYYAPVYSVSLVDLPAGSSFFMPNILAPQPVAPEVKEIPKVSISPKIIKSEKIPVIVAKIPEPKISSSVLNTQPENVSIKPLGPAVTQTPKIAIGSAGTGLATEGIPFPYPYYLVAVQNKVSENWQPPAKTAAVREAKTVVFFQILRDGKVTDVQVEQSSGSTALDAAALRAVKLADPLPPLPQGFKEDTLRVHFGFVYYESR